MEALERLKENLAAVRAEIAAACSRSGRSVGSVSLLAVVKYVGPEVVALLAQAGVRELGESTLQGALAKSEALPDHPGLRWHLIGHLQRNKARKAVRLFREIHSLDSIRLASKLEEELKAREEENAEPVGVEEPWPRLYLEINLGGQATKTGIPPETAAGFLEEIRKLPRVLRRIAGLMGIPPPSEDPPEARPHFRDLRGLRDRLAAAGLLPPGAGLSMGMSADYPVAIEEGSTVVRVGSRLFEGIGERRPNPPRPQEPRWSSS